MADVETERLSSFTINGMISLLLSSLSNRFSTRDLRGESLPASKRTGKQNSYFLQVGVDDVLQETGMSSETSSPEWKDSFHL